MLSAVGSTFTHEDRTDDEFELESGVRLFSLFS